MSRILIIEDDVKLRSMIEEGLRRNGFTPLATDDFARVKEEVVRSSPDLVIIDINLPQYDGFYWCRQIRTVSKVPVVFLSARTGDMDQVLAMENGGDDYVTKPFSLEVLIAKIRSLLRRVYGEYAGAVPSRLRTVGPLLLDEDRGQIACGERRTDLSHTEFRLLDLLARQAGRVVGREELLAALWDDVSFVDDNTLNVNVARVRRKLEEVGFPGGIATKRGQGYRLEVGDGPDRPGGPTGPGEGASGR